MICALFAG